MTLHYKGQEMEVFHQMRVGRLRLYHAALEKESETIQAAWRENRLGALFKVSFIADQEIGEEVHDSNGRLIAVFGATISNAFVPNPEPRRKYLAKVATLLGLIPNTKED
jgi:hypothetical protein